LYLDVIGAVDVTKPWKSERVETREVPKPHPQLLYLVKRWYAAIKGHLDEIAGAHDLTTAEYTMLSFLKRLEPCSAAELSRKQGITSQAVTQQVAPLKAKGMVTSTLSEANRRISLISLTERGRTSLAAVNVEAHRLETRMMIGLGAEERDAIRAFLFRSIEAIEGSDCRRPEADDE
jgi:DNA-binding MarR family transcriptional regulator